MQVSILLHTNNSEKYLESFYRFLLKQTSEIGELIILDSQSTDTTMSIANEIEINAPFKVLLKQTKNSKNPYLEGMEIANHEIILFANPKHPFKSQKVALYKRYFEEDPYFNFVFANTEVINEEGKKQIDDFFGISGFYERWDYYKSLSKYFIKHNGFVEGFQVGIRDKTAEKILNFYAAYPTFETENICSLIAVYMGLKFPATIKEIPYVLNKYRLPNVEIENLKEKKPITTSIENKIAWLKNYKGIVTLIDNDSELISQIQKAIDFQNERLMEKSNSSLSQKGSSILNYLTRRYHKYHFSPYDVFKKDFIGE